MPPQPANNSHNDPFESYEARKESRKTLFGFSLIYLTGYFTDPPATFHPQLVHSLEDEAERRLLIIGFRGSGKSTFGSLALLLWAALEYPERYPFIILVATRPARRRSTSPRSRASSKTTCSSSRTMAK
jgi:hypothetical protein